jgi:hypothetical protein
MIRPVSYAEILSDPNAADLLRQYAEECASLELGAPKPQPELYDLMERSGGFHAFGVYREEKLIGFACVMIYTLPHFGTKIAASESLFIEDSSRSTVEGRGEILLDHIEDFARDESCVAFIYSAPMGSRFDRLLAATKRGRHSNNVYTVKL